jgi:hypothetical protein
MANSRSPREFLERRGIVPAHVPPRPRLDIRDLLVNTEPLDVPPEPEQKVLRQLEGEPPPDRQEARPWPDQ